MKRQRGRNRNKNRNNNNHNNFNRSMDSQGPDVKVRGNAATIYEKYTTLARDAKMGGSRVKAENLLQHAEHYLRLMNVQEAAKQEAREKAEAERAAREEARANSDEDSEDQGGRNSRRNRNNRRDRDETIASDENSETPSALEVVTPKADAPKVKLEKKARKSKEDVAIDEAADEKPKRRRKAPARKASSEDEAVEAAE